MIHTSNMVNRQIWPDEVQPVEKLAFEHVEPKYVKVVIARITLVYLLLMGCATLILTSDYSHKMTVFIAGEIVLALAYVINVAMSAKIFAFKGYALRDHDITYRSGIFFPKTTKGRKRRSIVTAATTATSTIECKSCMFHSLLYGILHLQFFPQNGEKNRYRDH